MAIPTARRVSRIEGTVGRVDTRGGGWFTCTPGEGVRGLVVYLPARASRSDVLRFQRLTPGARVRAEVLPVRRDAAELVRFR